MNIKNIDKNQTGTIFLAIYFFTIVLGFFIYILGIALSFTPVMAMLIADVVMTVFIFLIGLLIKNASLYDPYWSIIPPFMYLFWLITLRSIADLPSVLILIVLFVWGIRLTYNWWKNWEGFGKQDWRYDMLRDKNKKLYPLTNFFGIHMIPTAVVFIQMINTVDTVSAQLNVIFILGLLISLSAPIIQYIADKQMYEFRKNNLKKKGIINKGLWKYSRHPNYFGELLFWIGIYVIYFSSTLTIDYHIIFPILMIMLFVFISVPMMENKIKNREGFEEYKKTVSMIIPFFNKKKS